MHEVVDAGGKNQNLWRHKKPDLQEFLVVRDGDHLLSPFICHICLFCILQNRDMDSNSTAKISLESALIRTVLDVL